MYFQVKYLVCIFFILILPLLSTWARTWIYHYDVHIESLCLQYRNKRRSSYPFEISNLLTFGYSWSKVPLIWKNKLVYVSRYASISNSPKQLICINRIREIYLRFLWHAKWSIEEVIPRVCEDSRSRNLPWIINDKT